MQVLPFVSVLLKSKDTQLSKRSPGVNLLLLLLVVSWGGRGERRRLQVGARGGVPTSRLYLGNPGWVLHPP